DAVLAASIFHFAEHSIADAKSYLHARGVAVRRTDSENGESTQ
ncbi:MAG: imidazole glycerol phosphate synthase subunit HisF, partial [Candidatus Tectomicrobia bacterium]|nr:imidazole glycerol phosphate synthase subunit HisF [Candidatus Tectomicrobia bacterium]